MNLPVKVKPCSSLLLRGRSNNLTNGTVTVNRATSGRAQTGNSPILILVQCANLFQYNTDCVFG